MTIYLLSLAEGLLTFVSPCILPLLPVYLSYLAGQSMDLQTSDMTKGRLLIHSMGFVIGMTLIFVLLGATATTIGGFLKGHQDIFRQISGLVMMVFGLSYLGLFELKFLNFQKSFNFDRIEMKFSSSILFGMVFAFGWTPCVGYLLSSALLMAGSSETVYQGMGLLLAYSLGLGVPFILSAVLFENLKGLLSGLRKYNKSIKVISGLVLMVAGLVTLLDGVRLFTL